MILKKIISGGQTGADRAALDVAIKLNIKHGGWIPKGRKTEAGPLPEKYHLIEMPTDDYRERTQKNIIESQGTVIISRAELTGGSKLTQSYAKVIGRPYCSLNLTYTEEYEASEILKSFILENGIEVLNVAGPRLSQQPWIYQDVKTVLEVTFFQLFLSSNYAGEISEIRPSNDLTQESPATVAEAVGLLCNDLSLKAKSYIANLKPNQMFLIYFGFQEYIKNRLSLNKDNRDLIEDCIAQKINDNFTTVEDAVMVIVLKLKEKLEPDHILRVIK